MVCQQLQQYNAKGALGLLKCTYINLTPQTATKSPIFVIRHIYMYTEDATYMYIASLSGLPRVIQRYARKTWEGLGMRVDATYIVYAQNNLLAIA